MKLIRGTSFMWDLEQRDTHDGKHPEDSWESCRVFRDGATRDKKHAEYLLHVARRNADPGMEYRLVQWEIRATKLIEPN